MLTTNVNFRNLRIVHKLFTKGLKRTTKVLVHNNRAFRITRMLVRDSDSEQAATKLR